MSNVATLIPKGAFVNTSEQVLKEAIDVKPDTVIVFCFVAGRVHIKTSCIHSNLELIGALEAAKQQVWSNA